MENRLLLAQRLLEEANGRIAKLEKERDTYYNMVKSLQSLVTSRLAQQQFDVNNLQRTFSQFGNQFSDVIKDLTVSFKTYTEKQAEEVKEQKYQQKLLKDQLNVKILKLKEVTKKSETLNKQLEQKDEEIKNEAVMRCMRCKARKAVINKLEREIITKTQEFETLRHHSHKVTAENNQNQAKLTVENNKNQAKLAAENGRLKETCQSQKREIFELKTKLQDEIDKNVARSSDPCLHAELSRTPANNSEDSANSRFSPYGDYQNFGRSDKEAQIERLQWLLTNKSAELTRTQRELHELRGEHQLAEEEVLFYATRSERFNLLQEEVELKNQELLEYNRKIAAIEAQLSAVNRQNEYLQANLDDSRQQNDTLQNLLTSLAASIQQTISN